MKFSHKRIFFFIKLCVSVLLIGYVINWLISVQYSFKTVSDVKVFPLCIALVLLIPNIWLEAYKWQIMVGPFYPGLKRKQAYIGVLAGMATGIFTPNRVGEYFGRVFSLPPGKRGEAVILTFLDRYSQMAVTCWAATLGVFYFFEKGEPEWAVHPLVVTGLLLVSAGFLVAAFSRKLVLKLTTGLAMKKAIFRIFRNALSGISPSILRWVIFSSMARYIIFTTQYYLVFKAFGFHGSFLESSCITSLIFLAKSIIPSIALSELGVREMVAIDLFSRLGYSEAIAFNATVVVFLINMILPALAGLPLIQFLGKEDL